MMIGNLDEDESQSQSNCQDGTLTDNDIDGKIMIILSTSDEIKHKFPKLSILDPNLRNQFQNTDPEAVSGFETLVTLFLNWRENPQNGKISSLILQLMSLGFLDTTCALGDVITNNGKRIKYYHSTPQHNEFYGRKFELSQLEEISSFHFAIDPRKEEQVIVINGSFGIGKSSLAIRFGDQFCGNVIWINGESPATIERQFQNLAKSLKIPYLPCFVDDIRKIVRKCYEYFRFTQCLFIFDNVENHSQISKYLPSSFIYFQSIKPIILITSRDTNSWSKPDMLTTCFKIELKALQPEDSLEFLKHELGMETSIDDLNNLAQELGNYPQAMKHACSSIQKLNSITEYLRIYKNENDELRKKFEGDSSLSEDENYYNRSLLASWTHISKKLFPDIKQNQENFDVIEEYKVMILIAYGSPDFLPKNLFDDLDYGEVMENILKFLEDYSIIYSREDSCYFTIHRAVQKVIRIQLSSMIGKLTLEDAFVNLIRDINALLGPKKHKVSEYKNIVSFLETLETISSYIIEFGILKSQIEFVQNLWHFYNVLEFYREALDYSERIVDALSSEKNDKDKRYLLQMKYCKGISLIHQYQAENSCHLLQEVYNECEAVLRITDPLTLKVRTGLAFVLNRCCKFKESIELYEEILTMSDRLKYKLHRIRAKKGLAETQARTGDHENSARNFNTCIEECLKELGPDHYQTRETQFMMCIASLRIDSLLENARGLMKSFKELTVTVLGYKHILTLKSFLHYSEILRKLGKFEEAEKVIDEFEKNVTPAQIVLEENPLALEFNVNKFKIKERMGKVTIFDVLKVQLENLETIRTILESHADKQIYINDALEDVGNTYFALGLHSEALKYFQELYQEQLKIYTEDNKLTKKTRVKVDELLCLVNK